MGYPKRAQPVHWAPQRHRRSSKEVKGEIQQMRRPGYDRMNRNTSTLDWDTKAWNSSNAVSNLILLKTSYQTPHHGPVRKWPLKGGYSGRGAQRKKKKGREVEGEKVDIIQEESFWGEGRGDHKVMCMWSLLPKERLQLGHLRDRDVRRSSTQSLQKTWPHVLMTVFLKLRRQTVHSASV